jgi:hypothetical protein
MLVDADRTGFTGYWADFFGMLRVAGLEVPHMVQTLTRVGAAVGVLGLCWHAHRSQSRVQAHVLQFSLAASFLLLMNPRTENNTYALLAPALAIISSQALLVHKRYVKGSIVLVCAALVLSSYEVGRLFVEPGKAIFLAPLGCLALFVVLLREVLPGNSLAPGDVGLELATHRTLPEHARSQCPSFLDRSPS